MLFIIQSIVNEGNGCETRQSSLLYVFVLFYGRDPAQNTLSCLLRTDELTNRKVLVT